MISNLLVVESEVFLRRIVDRRLLLGARVLNASTLCAALDLARENDIGAAIIAAELSDGPGLFLARLLRRRRRPVPVLLVARAVCRETVNAVQAIGATQIIRPFPAASLIAFVKRSLPSAIQSPLEEQRSRRPRVMLAKVR